MIRSSGKLITLFSEYPNARLELRTKTTTIENLLKIKAADNIVVSWTFSPRVIVDTHEHKAPSLEERIKAAVDVQKAGYNVGICLDPIILCDDWFDHYKAMLESFITERTQSISWLKSLEHVNWNNSFEHSKLGTLTAKHFLANWLAHDYLHIRQIIRLKFNYLKQISNQSLDYAGNW